MLLYVSAVNYNVNSNYISAANLQILWRHLPTELWNV